MYFKGVLVDGVILEGAFKNARRAEPQSYFYRVIFLNSPCSAYFCNGFSCQTNFTAYLTSSFLKFPVFIEDKKAHIERRIGRYDLP
jgi:hypothetical protein